MPIAFRCPSCSQVLKVPDKLAGGKGKCPKCGAILAIPAAKKVVAEEAPRPPAREPRPSEPAIMQEKALKTRPRPAEEELDEVDDEQEDDEELESPRAGRKKKKQKKSPVLFYSLLGGGLLTMLLACSGIGWFCWWYFFSSNLGDDLKFMPTGCQVIVSIRVDEFMKSQTFQDVKKEFPEIDKGGVAGEINKEMGIAPEDIEQVVVGVGGNSKDVTVVLHTKKAVQASDFRPKGRNVTYNETKIGKYVMQEPQDNVSAAYCMLDKKRVLMGDKNAVHGVVTRDKEPEMNKNLQDMLKEVKFSSTFVVVANVQGVSSLAPNMGFPGQQNEFTNLMQKTLGVAFESKIAADVDCKITLLCGDSTSADDVKKLIDAGSVVVRNNQQMPKEFKDLMEWNLKVSGNKITGNNKFKVGPLVSAVKQQLGGAMKMPGGGGMQPPRGIPQPGGRPTPGKNPRPGGIQKKK